MKLNMHFKLRSRHLLVVLAALALVLIAMGLAGALGAAIPQKTASDVSNLVILAALGVLFYSRKLRADEAKAKAAEDELAAAAGGSEDADIADVDPEVADVSGIAGVADVAGVGRGTASVEADGDSTRCN